MAKPGRKQKHAELKLIEGNPGHRPIVEPIKPYPVNIDPPEWLGEFAKEEWAAKAEELAKHELLNTLTQSHFAIYCTLYAEFKKLSLEGEPDRALKYAKEARMYGNEFGFTPAAIGNIPKKDDSKSDEMDNLLNGQTA